MNFYCFSHSKIYILITLSSNEQQCQEDVALFGKNYNSYNKQVAWRYHRNKGAVENIFGYFHCIPVRFYIISSFFFVFVSNEVHY